MDSLKATRSLIVPLARSYLCDTTPPVAKEFNNADTSDLVIRSGERTFHVHRLILSCASPVFRRMLEGNWKERDSAEISLNDDAEDLVEQFLHFLYSGHIIMQSYNIVRYYALADKYNVKSLTSVCRKHILEGLQVTAKILEETETSVIGFCPHKDAVEVSSELGTCDDFRDVSDWFSQLPRTRCYSCRLELLNAAMHFSLMSVVELTLSSSRRIASAAYHCLLVSLLKIHNSTHSWATACSIPLNLLLQILQDSNFFTSEDTVFDLAFEWLQFNSSVVSDSPSVVLDVLSAVRLPLLSRENLYRIQMQLRRTSWMTADMLKSLDERLRMAERYQLYANLPEAVNQEDWSGPQFTHRNGVDIFVKVVERHATRGSYYADADDSS